MTNTLAQVEAFAAAHPHRDNGEPWATSVESWCEAFIHEAGAFSQTYGSAYLAARASGPLAPDKAIVLGHIYYFSGGAGGAGHDAYGTERGLLMVSSAVPAGKPGYLPSVDAYLKAKPFMTYLGHTPRHGTQTLAGISTAGLNGTPLTEQEEDMPNALPKLIRNYDTSIGLVTADGFLQPISSMNEYQSLLRLGMPDFDTTQTDGTVWNALAERTARLAPHIDGTVVAAKISDDDIAKIAQASATATEDEAAKRLVS